jgi:hypothetical protein
MILTGKEKIMEGRKGISILLIFLLLASVKATIWTSGNYQIGNGDIYDSIYIYNDVTVEIFDGSQIQVLFTYDETAVTMYGGWLSTVNVFTPNNINIFKGGTIECINADGNFNSVHIYGQKFNFEQETFGYTLTGQWGNSLPFSIYLRHYNPAVNPVVLHEIPEPTTFLVLGLGYFLIKRRS